MLAWSPFKEQTRNQWYQTHRFPDVNPAALASTHYASPLRTTEGSLAIVQNATMEMMKISSGNLVAIG